jgi:hypothetical protein
MTITVTSLEQTCGACPSQWEGRTIDGDYLYIRYRFGTLTVNLNDARMYRGNHGDPLDGSMSTGTMARILLLQGITIAVLASDVLVH